jgi:hypothetical protein
LGGELGDAALAGGEGGDATKQLAAWVGAGGGELRLGVFGEDGGAEL